MENQKTKKSFKQKFLHEFSEYLVNFVYMSIIFSAIILYRRLALAQHGIVVEDYFLGVIKAFVIAKVVMLGAFLAISHKFEHKPLFIPILYKALLFTLMVMAFDVVEEFIRGAIHAGDLLVAFEELKSHINYVWLGGSMLIFFTFIPFFGVKELIRILGKDYVISILLERRKS